MTTKSLLATILSIAFALQASPLAEAVEGEVLEGEFTLVSLRDGTILDRWRISPECGDDEPYVGCEATISGDKTHGTAQYLGQYSWRLIREGKCAGMVFDWNSKRRTGEVLLARYCDTGGASTIPFKMVEG